MPAVSEPDEASRLRVGVIGAGVIGQVMHLHFLRELSDRFEIAALCDLSPSLAKAIAQDYGVPAVFTDWRELVHTESLEAVLVLTSGSHAPIAVEAARAGKHVFVEKPMCFSTTEASEMIQAAAASDVELMVGYPKRYDPAFARFSETVSQLSEPRLLRITTTESPFQPYIAHYPIRPTGDDVEPEVLAALREDSRSRLVAAIGTNDPFLVEKYQMVLLDTLVHEINTARALLGEPDRLEYVDIRDGLLTAVMTSGSVTTVIHWVDVPAMTRYSMEFAVMASDGRAVLTFPSPYLRNAPARLTVEGGHAADVSSFECAEVSSFESGFRAELVAFHTATTRRERAPSDGVDGARDIAVCEAIIRSITSGSAVERPSEY